MKSSAPEPRVFLLQQCETSRGESFVPLWTGPNQAVWEGGEDREGNYYGLSVADKFTVSRSFLRVQMVVQYLVEAFQADAVRFFFLVVANLRPAPDTLDREFLVHSLGFFHGCTVSAPRYVLMAGRLNAG